LNQDQDTFKRFDNMKEKKGKEKEDEAFFSDSFSVLFNPHKFVFDFKQSTPKVKSTEEGREVESVVWHKPVVMDPVLAKKILTVLKKNLEKYEEKFGEIEIGERKKGSEQDVEAEDAEEPTYIG